jgi:hypothetical protein
LTKDSKKLKRIDVVVEGLISILKEKGYFRDIDTTLSIGPLTREIKLFTISSKEVQ